MIADFTLEEATVLYESAEKALNDHLDSHQNDVWSDGPCSECMDYLGIEQRAEERLARARR